MAMGKDAIGNWRRAAGMVAAFAMSAMLAGGAVAASTSSVDTKVISGTRTATIENVSLGSVNYDHVDQTMSGTLVLTVDDKSGTNAGWHVLVQSSDFVYSGTFGGSNLVADNFVLTSAADPVKIAGQGVTPPHGPKVPTTSPVGTLKSAREVVEAGVNHGKGTYTQNLGVQLLVPADTAAGTYTGTLTVTIVAGP